MSKKITINKLNRVDVPVAHQDGVVAFQLVEFVVDFFGRVMTSTLDTKIMEDGRQLVIDGDGFIPAGYEVT